jgi:hypothetical protein
LQLALYATLEKDLLPFAPGNGWRTGDQSPVVFSIG